MRASTESSDSKKLNGEIFYTLKEIQVLIERWRLEYNTVRPHSSLNNRPGTGSMAALRDIQERNSNSERGTSYGGQVKTHLTHSHLGAEGISWKINTTKEMMVPSKYT